SLFQAIGRRDLVYVGFVLFVFLNLLVESFLEVQSGITFVAFFLAFFSRNEFQVSALKRKQENE
ncbi:MAG: hypothetical protein AAF193_04035, partial [Bacteroidota bacterium]